MLMAQFCIIPSDKINTRPNNWTNKLNDRLTSREHDHSTNQPPTTVTASLLLISMTNIFLQINIFIILF